jgi:hypothetical protein
MTRADLEKTKLDGEGLAELVGSIVTTCVGQVDFSQEVTALSPTAKLVLGELGSLVGVTADQMADAPLDELHNAVLAFWGANANGPLGTKVRGIIAGLAPMVGLAQDVVMTGFQKEFIKVLHVGGTPTGGGTGSSPQSSKRPSGQSATFSTAAQHDPSLNLPPASDTMETYSPQSVERLMESRTATVLPDTLPTATDLTDPNISTESESEPTPSTKQLEEPPSSQPTEPPV